MENKVVLNVYEGYRIIERKYIMDVENAEKILCSSKRRLYTKAVRNDRNVELISNFAVCPHCYSEFNVTATLKDSKAVWKLSNDPIRDWSSVQISFFDDMKDNVLVINLPSEQNVFRCGCPKCGFDVKKSEQFKKVEISLENYIVRVKSEVKDVCDILSLKWTGNCFSYLVPLYETLSFDIENGKISIILEDGNGSCLSEKEVTENQSLLKGCITYNIISSNKKVKRILRNMFSKVWGAGLPYSWKNINVNTLFEMTRFVGYKEAFYPCIPYVVNCDKIDETFEEQIHKLHNAKNIVGLYENSSLPKVKSVKKIFYDNPGFFFYLEEAEMLSKVITDVNLYCQMLGFDNIFSVLSDLHIRFGIFDFVRDYAGIAGQKRTLKQI